MAPTSIAILVSGVVLNLVPSGTAEFIDSMVLFNKMCHVLAEEPSFKLNRLFELWANDLNWNTRETPFDYLVFTTVTSDEIKKFRKDMGKLLVAQPVWHTAVAIMRIEQQSRLPRPIMLFPDGKPGRFIGVPNHRQVDPVGHIKRKSVNLYRLQMLMLLNASFLIVMDCDTGETSLSHRDTLQLVWATTIYTAAFRVPFPVRYSHLYTGIKIPDIPADHPPEPLPMHLVAQISG